ncbi:MAG TPA: hypothetical protein PLE61_13465 [Vicinamibacterales bacterium]|nr:hypothetical protein [Vicinamibacterales bacterium]HPW21809.1 hypothetical protein [Vicinamibacterales bacterium]
MSRPCTTSAVLLAFLAWCAVERPASAEAQGRQAAGQAKAAPSCGCPDVYDPETRAGIVWRGARPAPDLPTLARWLAPALWFSSDEPLIVLRQNDPIPHAHPCDRPSDRPVVYYQATEIVLRGDARVAGTGEADPGFFDTVDHFVLRYFFYYDEDYGLGRHAHDIEAIDLLVHLERERGGCLAVRVARVTGLAHGVHWYSNILNVERDTVFPIAILVEEGKHASVPDRNGDGVYTPGYDVNARVNDAWGLRDIMGSSVLMGSRYSAVMSKPRIDAFKLLPPDDAPLCGVGRRGAGPVESNLGRYVLRSALDVPVCHPPGPEPERLLGMIRHNRFGAGHPPRQYESDLARELSDPENAFRWVSAVNARLDSSRLGVSVQGPGLDLREVWLVPRANFTRGWAAQLLATPSASRWADWYVAAGYERGLITAAADGAEGIRRPVNGFTTEVGMKFRVAVSGKARWALLGYRFGGIRLGVCTSGWSRLKHTRFVVEIGAGVF